MEAFFLSIIITVLLSDFTKPMIWRRNIAGPLAVLQVERTL
jgi:hypothetical protein